MEPIVCMYKGYNLIVWCVTEFGQQSMAFRQFGEALIMQEQ